ncbi:MAG: PEP-CTERM sorting domain-containing protein, partial [Acidobacteriaceae bacterium]|nr:PEP-CTERM sorting domain-containing protein [Acidobacteriaceae bacterium]
AVPEPASFVLFLLALAAGSTMVVVSKR